METIKGQLSKILIDNDIVIEAVINNDWRDEIRLIVGGVNIGSFNHDICGDRLFGLRFVDLDREVFNKVKILRTFMILNGVSMVLNGENFQIMQCLSREPIFSSNQLKITGEDLL